MPKYAVFYRFLAFRANGLLLKNQRVRLQKSLLIILWSWVQIPPDPPIKKQCNLNCTVFLFQAAWKQKKAVLFCITLLFWLVPAKGVEPSTFWLQVSCSTNWAKPARNGKIRTVIIPWFLFFARNIYTINISGCLKTFLYYWLNAAFSKRAYCPIKVRYTLPVGPFLCLPIMASAKSLCSVAGL